MNGPDVASGTIVAVLTDEEIIPYRLSNQKKGYRFYRTTEGDFYGIIDADFSTAINSSI